MHDLLTQDNTIVEFVNKINKNRPYLEVKTNIKLLKEYLFDKFCKKGYLTSCEPEYCSFRTNQTCDFVLALQIFNDHNGIDLVKGVLIDE